MVRKQGPKNSHNEQGSALVAVMAVIAVLSVMVAHLTVSSEIAAREARVLATRTSLRYSAESAAERGFWMLLADRREFGSQQLGTLQPLELGESERWLADGSLNRLEYGDHTVEVKLLDANRGLDVSGSNPGEQLQSFLQLKTEGLEQVEQVNRFLAVLLDYVDRDPETTRRLHGKTRADYEAEGWPDLPRRGPLREREELIWIDGVAEIVEMLRPGAEVSEFMETIRLIPPPDRSFPDRDRPSFFSSSHLLVQQLAGLNEEEMERLSMAYGEWREMRGNFFDYLEPDLAARVRGNFSFSEPRVVTVMAKARSHDNLMQRQIKMTRSVTDFIQSRGDARVMDNWHRVLY